MTDSDADLVVQHTPGPWTPQTGLTVRAADGRLVARCAGTLGKYELEKANVHLIAAAPAMLAALRAFSSFADLRRAELGELSPEMEAAATLARTVIAQAERTD